MSQTLPHPPPLEQESQGNLPLLGRNEEAARLRDTILLRQPLLIAGPAGIGKTALLSHVLPGLPRQVRNRTLHLDGIEGLQPLLRGLLRELERVGDATLRARLGTGGIRSRTFEDWLGRQSTSRLKGAVYQAMGQGGYAVLLDHVPSLTHGVAKVVRELVWMQDTPVYLAVRDQRERTMGDLANVYWGTPQRLALGALPDAAALELLERSVVRLGLGKMDLGNFRQEILKLAAGNPGAIVNMCRLAADSKYHYGSRIKTKLVYIDHLMSLRSRFACGSVLSGGK